VRLTAKRIDLANIFECAGIQITIAM